MKRVTQPVTASESKREQTSAEKETLFLHYSGDMFMGKLDRQTLLMFSLPLEAQVRQYVGGSCGDVRV